MIQKKQVKQKNIVVLVVIKNLVEKVTTELLQYIDKFRELKLTIPCDFNILQYRITNMSQLISFDLFNKYVFYQENDQNYLFSIQYTCIISVETKKVPNLVHFLV